MNSPQFDNLLFELGTEELPAKKVTAIAMQLKELLATALQDAKLTFDEIQFFATPRRLALMVINLIAESPATTFEALGPPIAAAFDEKGQPTPACLGFARKYGVEVSALTKHASGKMCYTVNESGKKLSDVVPALLEKALSQLSLGKTMRWGNSDYQFLRPVHWLVLLYGKEIIPTTLYGVNSNRITYGHRFLAPDAISLAHADDYHEALKKAYVIDCITMRRNAISTALQQAASKVNATCEMSEALLDEVTHLVEWPVVLQATFAADYLIVPKEALIAAIKGHQKSFALTDKNGKLLPQFLFVSNLASKQPEEVIAGNERVMRARLADAKFFYETDLKHPFEDWLQALAKVTYQQGLGNLAERAERLSNLSLLIAKTITLPQSELAARAGLLAKCDLMSQMVSEFPELQGIMGEYYAKAHHESPDVAVAIREHYLPRFAGDALPTSQLGAAVALAERIDILIGIFGINQQPTGDKDPFSLRRAALGLVRIIIELQLPLQLTPLLTAAKEQYETQLGQALPNKNVVSEVHQYIIERLRVWHQEQGHALDVINAVLACQQQDLNDFQKRIHAVMEFKKLAESEALAQANKRVSNILAKEKINGETVKLDPSLLIEPAEQMLAKVIAEQATQTKALYQAGQYQNTLLNLAALHDPINHFFDEVMVMSEEENIKNNRLTLLSQVRHLFLQVADISLLNS